MHFFKTFKEPQIRDVITAKPNKGVIGATFKGTNKRKERMREMRDEMLRR
jgi:hypothetical protein